MIQLDDKDWRIIKVLLGNGDYTTRQIAKKTLIPATTINNRVRKMKKEGVIKKFTIELDNRKLGRSFLAYVFIVLDLAVLKQKKKLDTQLAQEIKKLPNVERVDTVTGTTDIIAIVRASNVEDFTHSFLNRIGNLDGIKQIQSMIVLNEM